jgi:hypothetical protein
MTTVAEYIGIALLSCLLSPLVADTRGVRALTKEEMYSTALHEAGHAIVPLRFANGYVLEVWLNDVHPIHASDLLGYVSVIHPLAPTTAELWYHAVEIVAGGQSEAMFSEVVPEGLAQDQAKLKEAIQKRSLHGKSRNSCLRDWTKRS